MSWLGKKLEPEVDLSAIEPSRNRVLTPEGDHDSEILDVDAYRSRSGQSLLRFHIMVDQSRMTMYELAGSLTLQMVLAHKDSIIGRKLKVRVRHVDYKDEGRLYAAVDSLGELV